MRRALTPDGTIVMVAPQPGSGSALSRGSSARRHVTLRTPAGASVPVLGEQGRPVVLKELIEAGKVTPVIDRTYRSRDPDAIRHVEAGRARGKVVITF